jgi:hypothetical protein
MPTKTIDSISVLASRLGEQHNEQVLKLRWQLATGAYVISAYKLGAAIIREHSVMLKLTIAGSRR